MLRRNDGRFCVARFGSDVYVTTVSLPACTKANCTSDTSGVVPNCAL